MTPEGSRCFLVVTGKGGVGKTTVCAAEAQALAASGKRVLVAMCHGKERLSTMLGSARIGHEVVGVAPNVWAVNMDPMKAVEEYGLLTLKVKVLYKTVFENRFTRPFMHAVPGLEEWAMLGKAWWHTTEVRADGAPKYDVVILDAPATGHGLTMLRVPKIIVEAVPPGILRRDAERARALFRDPLHCGVILVTVPEEMPVSETIELGQALTSELSMPLAKLVVNAVLPQLFSREERAALLRATTTQAAGAEAAIRSAQARVMRECVQAESLARLSNAAVLRPVPKTFFPLLFKDAARPEAIAELARLLLVDVPSEPA
jgi:anion-transporting  ArsA/GET3 family ATPase